MSIYLKQYSIFAVTIAALLALCFFFGLDLLLPISLGTLFIYMQAMRKEQDKKLLYALFLFMLSCLVSYLLVVNQVNIFYIPITVFPMLASLLFGELVTPLFITLGITITAAIFSGDSLSVGLLFTISGFIAVLLCQNLRKRMGVLRAGMVIGLIQPFCLFLLEKFQVQDSYNYIILGLNGLASGVIVLGVLPAFEHLFGTITNISLLESTDFGRPPLSQLMLEAPGTYHHSMVVGNLSEAACNAVGANSLLARVGAYYHDIGKLQKPDYFSENQDMTGNRHDALSPHMSKLVIMNHVKEGVELARKYRLNPKLIEFIEQHHGSSLVFYFYRLALEKIEDAGEVTEEGFRYPGPKPRSKETAIVLLADSVEAATRSLREPNPVKIEELVHKVINNKFIDGQLDDCDLTLRDLEKIARIFVRVLNGIYHARVVYPEQDQNNQQKT